jgi:UDP-glucose 4-epimerase
VTENKTIFITGGAGFIANRLIRHYIDKNKITVYDNFHRDTLTGSGLMSHPNLEVINGDVLDSALLTAHELGNSIIEIAKSSSLTNFDKQQEEV